MWYACLVCGEEDRYHPHDEGDCECSSCGAFALEPVNNGGRTSHGHEYRPP